MVDSEVIRHRLALLSEYIADLEVEKDVGLKEFLADKRLRRYVERTLHLAVESCIDIASHIISDEMAQFRNIIVHDYARLDAEVIWGILKRDLGDLHHFMLTIKKRLEIN